VRESELPLTLGLLVDTSLSQRRVLDQEKSASYSFFDHILREDKDRAFLIHFDREVELLRDLTASREKLRSGLEELDTPSFTNTSGGGGAGTPGGSGRGHGHGGGGTLLYDSIYLASNELMKKQQGRKALIILTDGVDHGSKESLNTAIATAQRADTAVYSILFADEGAYGNGGRGGYGGHGGYPGGGIGRGGPGRYPQQDHPDGKKVLERISKETGGQLFEVKKKLSIEQIYAQIEEELRNQYSLGYTPDRPGDDSTYHLIHVTVNQKDLIVQAREGYYSGPSSLPNYLSLAFRNASHQHDKSIRGGSPLLRNVLILWRIHELTKIRFVRERKHHHFIPAPVAFDNHRVLIRREHLSLVAIQHTHKLRLITSIHRSIRN
jgi:VWFA-related protein